MNEAERIDGGASTFVAGAVEFRQVTEPIVIIVSPVESSTSASNIV